MSRSAGKKIIITGASSGIGEALALEFAKRGGHLGLLARRKIELQELTAQLRRRFPSQVFVFHPADVGKEDDLSQAMRRLIDELGGLDIAIANSGMGASKSAFSSHAWEIARETFSVNLLGAIHTLEIAKEYFVRQRLSGQLVGISSVAGARGFPRVGAYCASKAALATYLESIRGELAGGGIHVLSVHPGYVRTPMVSMNRRMPWLIEPEDAARRIADAIEAGKKRFIFPAPMRLVYGFLKHMPDSVYDFWSSQRLKKQSPPE